MHRCAEDSTHNLVVMGFQFLTILRRIVSTGIGARSRPPSHPVTPSIYNAHTAYSTQAIAHMAEKKNETLGRTIRLFSFDTTLTS
jgi:hypothetical protein